MEFRILGPLEVLGDDGMPVGLGGKRPRAILAMLLLHPNEAVSTDRLIDAVWGEEPPASGAGALQVHVHALRKALGADRIVTRAPGYFVRVERDELDADRFARLVASGGAADLDAALALWRGPALADHASEPFARADTARLDDARLVATEKRIAHALDAGRHVDVVGQLDVLVGEHPHRERFQAQRMLALYRSGRQADALAAYRDARAALDELGLEPSPELRALEQRILRQDPELSAPSAPAAGSFGMSELIGRDVELVAITALLERRDVRLLTLTGTGGTGKTTLARAASAAAGGAPFVDLAATTDTALVVPNVASALGVDEVAGEPIVRTIGARLESAPRRLVVVDNLEHLAGASTQIAELLDAAPTLQILATSRSPLRIKLEREFRVEPLAAPPLGENDVEAIAATSAVQLYFERALELVPDLELSAETIEAAGRIARALDGLPLAIELAAARVRVFGVRGTAERIGEALSILARPARDVPERQRSLRATVEWSARLVDPKALPVLEALAVFSGGARLDAIELVSESPEAALGLDELIDASLVRSRPTPSGQPRFSMLETIRTYVREQMSDYTTRALRDRHLAWCIDVAEGGEPRYWLRGTPWLDEVEPELANIRTALDHALEIRDIVSEARLASSMRHYWRVRGHVVEGRSRLEDVLGRTHELEPGLRARLARETAVLRNAAGEYEGARALWLEALALYEELGNKVEVGRTLCELGTCAHAEGDVRTAITYYEAAVERLDDDEFDRLIALGNLADCYEENREPERARSSALEVLEAQRRNGDRDGVAYMSFTLATIELGRGELEAAQSHLAECIRVADEVGFVELVGYALGVASALALERGAAEESAFVLGAGLECLARLGVTPQAREAARHRDVLAALRARLADADAVVERGRAAELSEAVGIALQPVPG